MSRRKVLTDQQVRDIRKAYSEAQQSLISKRIGYGALAKQYNCSESTIRDLITMRTRWNVRSQS